MSDLQQKGYVAIVQCHIVMERCAGYFCEKALSQRTGGFAAYPAGKPLRHISLTCGGCCGRALHRKLSNLVHKAARDEGIAKEQIVVHLATCITKESYHGPACPHLEYLKTLISRLGLDVVEDTHVVAIAEKRRQEGLYGR